MNVTDVDFDNLFSELRQKLKAYRIRQDMPEMRQTPPPKNTWVEFLMRTDCKLCAKQIFWEGPVQYVKFCRRLGYDLLPSETCPQTRYIETHGDGWVNKTKDTP